MRLTNAFLFATSCIACFLAVSLLLVRLHARPTNATKNWKSLLPGLELLELQPDQAQSPEKSTPITILRIDPASWDLVAASISETGESTAHTAREWSLARKFTAAINAGMFLDDGKTHAGYFCFGEKVNASKANSYQSAVAFDPKGSSDLPRFRIFDLDHPKTTIASIANDYSSVAQNLRLIKKPGSNQWPEQEKKWSEAALGEDDKGRILFIFSRAPYSMHEFNRILLTSGIGVVAAQHLEGGPEAQLYIHAGNFEKEMLGSYETSFNQNDTNAIPWPIPNVFGIRPRATTSSH